MANTLKTIKPLVIGFGVAGKRHLEAQLSLGVKTGVYTTNSQSALFLRGQKNVIVFDNLQDGLDWSNLVHVCTPDDLHTKFVAAALETKKAVLCEKAFTTSLEDALYLQKLAKQFNTKVFVGQNYRLTPTFLETRKQVLEGGLGTITKIETTYLHDADEYQQRKPVRKNQDFLYIGGSHAVDLACWVINQPIVSIHATSKNELNYQIICTFASGLLGSIKLDATSSQSRNGTDLIVEGEKGKLVSHNKLDKLLFYKEGSKKPISVKFPNTRTYTTALEVKIIDNYLLGRIDSYWPLPNIDEAVNTIRILDIVSKTTS